MNTKTAPGFGVAKLAATAAVSVLTCVPAWADDDVRRFSADDIFNLEYAASPQVSPNSDTIAYVRTRFDRMADARVGSIWTIDVESGAHRPLITDQGSVGSPRWSPNGDRLLYTAAGEDGPELRVWFVDDGSSFSIAQFEQSPQSPSWSPDGDQIAFAMLVPDTPASFAEAPKSPKGATWAEPVRVFDQLPFRFDGAGYLTPGKTHIHIVPAEGGSVRAITEGVANYSSPVWLDDDTLIAVVDAGEGAISDPIESDVVTIEVASGEITTLTDRDGPDTSPTISPNGEYIAYLGYDDEVLSYQQTQLYVMPVDGGEARLLTGDVDRSIGAIQWREDSNSLIVMHEDRGDMVLSAMDLDGGVSELTRKVGGTSIGRPYSSGSFHTSGDIIAFTHAHTARPGDLAMIDQRGRVRQLTELNEDALGHVDLADIEAIEVESPIDGAMIQAWIALPPGFEADGSAPMVMEIHGGPFAMYGPTFSAEIQRYAAEGYVTVYANPRGSTGYGEAFAQEIDLAYPGEDYDDLMAVVDELIAKDYVDPDRLFVTGGSGGGVLTAWIVGSTDRFAAAASIKPVMNWTTMALAADIAPFVVRHWLRAEPWDNPDRYWELSPISRAGNITTPTMVMVGEEDWRTPTWEAEQLYTALKLQGVDTALVRVPGSPHFIAGRPSQMIAKVDNIMGWFEKHDPANEDDEDGESGDGESD